MYDLIEIRNSNLNFNSMAVCHLGYSDQVIINIVYGIPSLCGIVLLGY
jgi:hypothetical protein